MDRDERVRINQGAREIGSKDGEYCGGWQENGALGIGKGVG